MVHLYNCRHSGDQYRITKFDHEMNVVSSYLCTTIECDCPSGARAQCRHRNMLHNFISRGHIGDEWFLDFDRGGWVQMGPEWSQADGYGPTPDLAPPEEIAEHMSMAQEPPSPKHIPRRL